MARNWLDRKITLLIRQRVNRPLFIRKLRAALVSTAVAGMLVPGMGQAALPATAGWYAIPQTQLRTVCPPDNFAGTTYSFNTLCPGVVAAWNSGVMDTTRNRLIVWGGGHNDYAGNELYAVNLDDLTIQRLNNPTTPTNARGICAVTTLANGTPGGTPNSRHTYDGLAYIAHADKMFAFGGSPACAAGGFSNDTWVYDFATSAWQKKAPTGPIPHTTPGAVTAYDDASGMVFVHDDASLYSYDLAMDRYTKLASDKIDYHMSAVIDPVRKKLVLIGGGEAWAYDIGPGSAYFRQVLSTTGGDIIVNGYYPGLAYDPSMDRIVAWNGGDTVYSLNVATGAWTATTYPGGPGKAQPNGTYKRWSYSPASGVFVLVNSMTQNAYSLRLGPAGQVWRDQADLSLHAKVVEFYNVLLDHYLVTADAADQNAIDGGYAGPGWQRTGTQFSSGGTTAVCRFYGSQNPGPNSHFYTADAGECAHLKQIQSTTPPTEKRWNFESNDFRTTPAVNAICQPGTMPIYRAYNEGLRRGIDSNHRLSPSAVLIAQVVARGWKEEGVVMCAPL